MINIPLFCIACLFSLICRSSQTSETTNPYDQKLPDCSKGYKTIIKRTEKKAILCPMIKNEEGFLSEWVAYYQMHGFNKIIFYDHGSTDNFIDELKPWLSTGLVEIRYNWTLPEFKGKTSDFFRTIGIKKSAESDCKRTAMKNGYDYFFSLDIDEYLIPDAEGVTIVDEMERFYNNSGRFIDCVTKLNFQSSPHILEPVDLLTIEAFQTRMKKPSRMSYYTSVANKCGLLLSDPLYTNESVLFFADCCNFHGCTSRTPICKAQHDYLSSRAKARWENHFVINHYSRSLEKFGLKSKSWTSATGDAPPGTEKEAARGYTTAMFLSRSVGWHTDRTALRYSCQLRDVLKNMTGHIAYLRPGLNWYRNPEFGKFIMDPEKRGRYGRPNPEGFKSSDENPYHYHGRTYGEHIDFPDRLEHKKWLEPPPSKQ